MPVISTVFGLNDVVDCDVPVILTVFDLVELLLTVMCARYTDRF